jgi:hypothetical protein
LAFSFLLLTASFAFGGIEDELAPLGQVIVTNLSTAPFPHPDRAKGYTYKDKLFPAEKHYNKDTVVLFIPKGFKPSRKTDYVVHFHGWGNDATNVFRFYKLAEQLNESKRNAVLVVPQGPYWASDSFGGKLEDELGFKRFMEDVAAGLKQRGLIKSEKFGNIIISGHSGGYHVMSSIVLHGGLSDKIKEVWLFDALYGQTPKFVQWLDKYHGKLIDIYTENGGTKAESEKLMADLKQRGIKFMGKNEADITAGDLKKQKLMFIYTPLRHNDVVHVHNTFRDYLSASCLGEVSKKR